MLLTGMLVSNANPTIYQRFRRATNAYFNAMSSVRFFTQRKNLPGTFPEVALLEKRLFAEVLTTNAADRFSLPYPGG